MWKNNYYFLMLFCCIATSLYGKNISIANQNTGFVLQPQGEVTQTTPQLTDWYITDNWLVTDNSGNLIIAANTIPHITSDTTLDGGGNKIIIGENTHLFVDTDVTLTIRNATIIYSKPNYSFPPIRLAAHGSKLALDNVKFVLNGDFNFLQGQLFVHNDVKITGTSVFIYTSPMPSWITANSRLYFDVGTTFSIAPASLTDAPINQTYIDSNFIKMADKSSQLYLNGCCLKATQTGIRLTKGTVLCDNANVYMSDTTITATGTIPRIFEKDYGARLESISWSPDGKFFAFGGQTPTSGNELQVYRFDGSSLTLVDSKNYGDRILGVHWSPDGKFIAIGGTVPASGDEIQIYRFENSSLSFVTGQNYGTTAHSVHWSPDSKFLAVGGATPTSGNEFQVYGFDGSSLTLIDSENYGTEIYSVKWSPDGHYLAIGGNAPTSGNELQVYRFDGFSLTLVDSENYGTITYTVAWSPDGRFIALGGLTPTSGNELQVYRFNGTTLTSVTSQNYGTYVISLVWSPNGSFLALGGQQPDAGNATIQLYQFTGTTLNTIARQTYGAGTANVWSAEWSPNSNYLAAGGAGPTSGNELQISKICFGSIITPQAFSKSIVFGDYAKGADYDTDVRMLAESELHVTGNINYDCVS
jgi:WD40 repeat protein